MFDSLLGGTSQCTFLPVGLALFDLGRSFFLAGLRFFEIYGTILFGLGEVLKVGEVSGSIGVDCLWDNRSSAGVGAVLVYCGAYIRDLIVDLREALSWSFAI